MWRVWAARGEAVAPALIERGVINTRKCVRDKEGFCPFYTETGTPPHLHGENSSSVPDFV